MPGSARKDIVRQGEIGVYHTWSRCVQKALLCGEDRATGQNFEHRREWIQKLLAYQASIFAIDIGNYTILSNHQHLICRTRPDIAESWSDEEVAWRWKMAWPRWEHGQWIREPTDEEVEQVLLEHGRIPQLRANLSSLSWFHARWKEPISKLANGESQKSGHFYEARFGSRELVDLAAGLCCNIYLDLNQMQAGMANSLEESHYSAIQDRLRLWRAQQAQASVKKFRAALGDEYPLETDDIERLLADCFLSPIDVEGPLLVIDNWHIQPPQRDRVVVVTATSSSDTGSPPAGEQESSQQPVPESGAQHEAELTTSGQQDAAADEPATDARQSSQSRGKRQSQPGGRKPTWKRHRRLQKRRRPRASDNIFLPMPPDQYREIAQRTAQQILDARAQPPPDDLEALLSQWQVDPAHWYQAVEHFATWFHHAVGKAAHLAELLDRRGRRWIQGIRHCRDVFT